MKLNFEKAKHTKNKNNYDILHKKPHSQPNLDNSSEKKNKHGWKIESLKISRRQRNFITYLRRSHRKMDSYMNDVFLTYEHFYFVLETSIAFKISFIYLYI